MERWVAGAMRALAIAADGVTKRCMPAAVRGRACTPNWRAGRPCRIALATQNNSTSGMVKPRAALPARGGDRRGIPATALPCIGALGMGDPDARSWRVSALVHDALGFRRVSQSGAPSLACSEWIARRVRAHNRHCGSAQERRFSWRAAWSGVLPVSRRRV